MTHIARFTPYAVFGVAEDTVFYTELRKTAHSVCLPSEICVALLSEPPHKRGRAFRNTDYGLPRYAVVKDISVCHNCIFFRASRADMPSSLLTDLYVYSLAHKTIMCATEASNLTKYTVLGDYLAVVTPQIVAIREMADATRSLTVARFHHRAGEKIPVAFSALYAVFYMRTKRAMHVYAVDTKHLLLQWPSECAPIGDFVTDSVLVYICDRLQCCSRTLYRIDLQKQRVPKTLRQYNISIHTDPAAPQWVACRLHNGAAVYCLKNSHRLWFADLVLYSINSWQSNVLVARLVSIAMKESAVFILKPDLVLLQQLANVFAFLPPPLVVLIYNWFFALQWHGHIEAHEEHFMGEKMAAVWATRGQ